VDFAGTLGVEPASNLWQRVQWALQQRNSRDRDEGTVQSWLTSKMSQHRRQLLKQSMPYDQLAWFVQLESSEAGLWLQDVPKFVNKVLSNEHFRTALRYRLYLDAVGIGVGWHCECGGHIDSKGLHFATGCALHNLRKETHDDVCIEIESKLRWMGKFTEREQKDLFQGLGPEFDNMRPDISIFNPTIPHPDFKQQILDVTVVGPLAGVEKGRIKVPSHEQALNPNLTRRPRMMQKRWKYRKSKEAKCQFQELVFRSTGGVEPDSVAFFKREVQFASPLLKIPANTLYRYVMREISVVLQQGVAEAINKRVNLIRSRTTSTQASIYR
jgi:hypothetical protein